MLMPTSTEKIFSEFKEHSVAEFFKKNQQMLGFSGKTRSLTTIVHEYVTNSLDACEEAQILPDVTITVIEIEKEKYKVIAEDNGPGIPEKHLGKALGMMLAGTKFHRYCQQRGQQGIGASGCTMYAQITTGKPVHVVSRYDSKRITCDLSIDLKSNSPRITDLLKEDGNFGSGLRVEAEVADVKYDQSSFGVYEYIRRTALANPHLQITLIDPEKQKFSFPRSDTKIPPKPVVVQPHPLGLSTNDLIDFAHREKECRRISSFLQERFTRVSAGKVDELKSLCPDVDFNKQPSELQWPEAEKIVKAIHSESVKWIAPATDSVIPIGQEQIEKSLKNIIAPEFVSVTERPPKIYKGGIPFMVEAAIAYGGGAGKKNGAFSSPSRAREGGASGQAATHEGAPQSSSEIIRYANRAPLLFDNSGCAITEAVKEIDWKRYKLKNFEEEPISIFVNLCSVYVPYTSAGKQAISDEEEVVQEIKNAIMEAARELQRYLGGKHRESDRKERKKAILRYVQQLSKDLPELAGKGKPSEIEKKLIELIETKYSGQIEAGEDEEETGAGEAVDEEEDEVEDETEKITTVLNEVFGHYVDDYGYGITCFGADTQKVKTPFETFQNTRARIGGISVNSAGTELAVAMEANLKMFNTVKGERRKILVIASDFSLSDESECAELLSHFAKAGIEVCLIGFCGCDNVETIWQDVKGLKIKRTSIREISELPSCFLNIYLGVQTSKGQ